jgi:replication factor C subunit 3/5
LKGLALSDIVKEIHPFIFRMGLPPKVKIMLIQKLADVEYRLASGTNERLQLGGLIGAFAQAREQVVRSAV